MSSAQLATSQDILLRAAYLADIFILLPILIAPHRACREPASAIAATSALGLIWPRLFFPFLVLQIIYKSVWLVGFVVPRWLRQGIGAVP